MRDGLFLCLVDDRGSKSTYCGRNTDFDGISAAFSRGSINKAPFILARSFSKKQPDENELLRMAMFTEDEPPPQPYPNPDGAKIHEYYYFKEACGAPPEEIDNAFSCAKAHLILSEEYGENPNLDLPTPEDLEKKIREAGLEGVRDWAKANSRFTIY